MAVTYIAGDNAAGAVVFDDGLDGGDALEEQSRVFMTMPRNSRAPSSDESGVGSDARAAEGEIIPP